MLGSEEVSVCVCVEGFVAGYAGRLCGSNGLHVKPASLTALRWRVVQVRER